MLVIAGSCSPVTAAQINKAKSNGFEEAIIDSTISDESVIATISDWMKEGKSVILHTDGINKKDTIPAEVTGTRLGTIARKIANNISYKRLVIAGGDTSSYAARALGIESVEMIASLVPGAPLCKANAPGSSIDGMEVNFKGGQVGDENYFEILLNGTITSALIRDT
jgi:uncharacterized protein YgbK (DUF1537 family)